jgi:hypothetical protein
VLIPASNKAVVKKQSRRNDEIGELMTSPDMVFLPGHLYGPSARDGSDVALGEIISGRTPTGHHYSAAFHTVELWGAAPVRHLKFTWRKSASRRKQQERRDDVPLDRLETSYLLQTTGALRQPAGGGGGPMSRCQTLPSSN